MKGTGMEEQGLESQSRTPKQKDLDIMSIEALGGVYRGNGGGNRTGARYNLSQTRLARQRGHVFQKLIIV